MLSSELLHSTLLLLASSGSIVSLKVALLDTAMVVSDGIAILSTGINVAVMVQVANKLSSSLDVALMVVVP